MDLLLLKAKTGDSEAFIQLMELQKQAMYKTALAILRNSADVADAMQETILACYKSLPKLKNDRYFKTWLTKILINKCTDILKQSRSTVPLDEAPEASYSADFEDGSLIESLACLGDNERLILTLYYVQDLTTREIAKLLALNENTVKTRLMRGRNHFKEAYLKQQKEGYTYG